MPLPPGPDSPDGCPVERTLNALSGKWRLFVLFRLADGPMRFNALRRSLAPVTQRVLTATLRALEEDGLVWRRNAGTVPPRVEYGLTARGAALAPVWEAMAVWGLTQAPRQTGGGPAVGPASGLPADSDPGPDSRTPSGGAAEKPV